MENLRTKLSQCGLDYARLSKMIGVAPNYLSEIGSGKKSPSLATAIAIEDATDGRVTARFLHSISPGNVAGGRQGRK